LTGCEHTVSFTGQSIGQYQRAKKLAEKERQQAGKERRQAEKRARQAKKGDEKQQKKAKC
jgi:hypothetical protein